MFGRKRQHYQEWISWIIKSLCLRFENTPSINVLMTWNIKCFFITLTYESD